MKARPILFSTAMVQAILDGRKGQTRRVVKPQPPEGCGEILGPERYAPVVLDRFGCEQPGAEIFGIYDEAGEYGAKCPYGQPGDLLWVRESYAAYLPAHGEQKMRELGYQFDGWRVTEKGETAILYKTSGKELWHGQCGDRWRPSIHMPRWANRLTLEITDIRVERLQDISEADAQAEGYPLAFEKMGTPAPDPRYWFTSLWETINGPTAWIDNPWVWVVEFTPHQQNIDDFLQARAA